MAAQAMQREAAFKPESSADGRPVVHAEVAGHGFTLFEESPPLMQAMVDDIRQAHERVWMETYIFADDAAGRAIADALADRARAGVDVRLMIDAWGSFSTPRALLNRLREAGVQLHFFHAFGQALPGPRWLRLMNQRNHRKLLVIDDNIAYFGGMNIVDQSGIHSKAEARQRHLPASAGWRDVHVRMVGPCQAQVAEICERLWNRVHHEHRKKAPRWPLEEMLRADHDSIFFFDSRPSLKNRRPHRVLVPLLKQARREIIVSMAYFIPVGRVLRELIRARRRGVRVKVIVPQQSDVKIVEWATRHFYEYLLKRGIHIYERRDRMLHSKAMVIDGRWSVVGSCNLDPRSLRMNLEFLAVIHSPQMAAALKRVCYEEICASERVRLAHIRKHSRWQRMLNRLAWAMRDWL
ncbi:MAG TPA: phosphatidylserine/phosphatidylglycerophosphate/cardiolipin synthase family protein [Pirellulales bacterium]|jgi:cardiolipin synthase|nr:phosphatidylserine/phosphatidylglycerophosphate/cardiolipin synthase family protein [Pirellulales bacterium]